MSILLIFLYLSAISADTCCRITRFEFDACEFHPHLGLPYGECGTDLENYKDALEAPTVTFKAEPAKKYVLFMVDQDAPSHANAYLRLWRHWVVSDLTKTELESGDIGLNGKHLTSYYPPSPPAGSGPHRYQFLLFEQPEFFNLKSINCPRGAWNFGAFLRANELCEELVATYQFTTEQRSLDGL